MKPVELCLIIALLSAAFAAAAPPSGSHPAALQLEQAHGQPAEQGNLFINATQVELLVHDGVNVQRQLHNVRTLGYDLELAEVARSHSRDMAERGYFAHKSPEGMLPSDRLEKMDYACEGAVGENIYYFQKEPLMDLTDSLATQLAITGWVESPGHRSNLIYEDFRREGIGAYANQTSIFVTQTFC